jgi:hypothetical protein
MAERTMTQRNDPPRSQVVAIDLGTITISRTNDNTTDIKLTIELSEPEVVISRHAAITLACVLFDFTEELN